MHELDLINAMSDWFFAERASLERRGLTVAFGRSPTDRDRTSSWLSVERGDRLGFLQIWSSGEVELETGGDGRLDVQEHHEIGGDADVAVVIGRLLELIGDSSS